jgi:hypothetical protein
LQGHSFKELMGFPPEVEQALARLELVASFHGLTTKLCADQAEIN